MLWGIDLGGTKLEGVVLKDSESLNTRCRIRIDTEASLGYEHILKRLEELVSLMEKETSSKPKSLGIGHPGATRPSDGTLKNSNTTCLNAKPLIEDLSQKLSIPVFGANDANCFALAESEFGAAKNYSNVFGIIMGTGVGGGVVLNGQVHVGAQGIAGEWGHNVVEKNGPRCYCGKCGCVETMMSGPALEGAYRRLTGEIIKLDEISKRWRLGEAQALGVKAQLISSFGQSVAQVVNILDPDAIVIGGGLSNLTELYSEGRDEVEKYVFNDNLETPILSNSLGDSAGVFGAALLTKGNTN